MSYSFSVTADSKADAIAKVQAEFDQVVQNQPTHAADEDVAVAAAAAFINLLAEPAEGEQITVTMYGSLGWRQTEAPADPAFTSGGVSVSVSLAAKSQA